MTSRDKYSLIKRWHIPYIDFEFSFNCFPKKIKASKNNNERANNLTTNREEIMGPRTFISRGCKSGYLAKKRKKAGTCKAARKEQFLSKASRPSIILSRHAIQRYRERVLNTFPIIIYYNGTASSAIVVTFIPLPKLLSLQQLKNTIRDELRVLPIMQNGGNKNRRICAQERERRRSRLNPYLPTPKIPTRRSILKGVEEDVRGLIKGQDIMRPRCFIFDNLTIVFLRKLPMKIKNRRDAPIEKKKRQNTKQASATTRNEGPRKREKKKKAKKTSRLKQLKHHCETCSVSFCNQKALQDHLKSHKICSKKSSQLTMKQSMDGPKTNVSFKTRKMCGVDFEDF